MAYCHCIYAEVSLVYYLSVSGVILMDVLYTHEAHRINELLNTGKICVEQARDMLNEVATGENITLLYANDKVYDAFVYYRKKPVYATDYENQRDYRVCDNASIQDVVRLLLNGDISYADALRWCQIYNVSEVWLRDGLCRKVIITDTDDKPKQTIKFHLKDILFKIVEILNKIVDWILEDFT